MCHVMADCVLVWKGGYILFCIVVLLAKVKDCSQLAILLENAEHWYSLAYCCGNPPACTGVSTDLFS